METVDITTLWITMLDKLKKTLPPQIYNTWIETSLIPYSFEENVFTLDTTNNFICSFITKKYTSKCRILNLKVNVIKNMYIF